MKESVFISVCLFGSLRHHIKIRENLFGFFVAFPVQMLTAPVAENCELPLQGYMASWAEIVSDFSVSGRKNQDFLYAHTLTVFCKESEDIP